MKKKKRQSRRRLRRDRLRSLSQAVTEKTNGLLVHSNYLQGL